MTRSAISIFSGPGGVCTGLADTDLFDTIIGVEWESDAVATATAAGHKVIQADVREVDPRELALQYGIYFDDLLFQASPPCQGLSMAGKGEGRKDLEHLLFAISQLVRLPDTLDSWEEHGEEIPALQADLLRQCSDDRSPLAFEVMRWIFDLNPDHIMLEQVPAALPIWQAIAEVLESWGYSVWCGNVQAEQFGVPQTRKRAILMASRLFKVGAPEPTHSKYHNRTPSRLDSGVLPWVSMAEALGWGVEGVMVSNYGTGGDPKKRGERKLSEPSPTVTSKIDRNKIVLTPTHMGDVYNSKGCIRSIHEPAPTMTASMDNGNFQFFHEDNPPKKVIDRLAVKQEVEPRVNNQSGTEFDLAWPADRPAPTIAGREIVTMPGANANRFNGSTKSRNDGIRVTIEEAGVLQSFPPDYPWQGNKSSKFQQCGNAVPPVLQRALTVGMFKVGANDEERASA